MSISALVQKHATDIYWLAQIFYNDGTYNDESDFIGVTDASNDVDVDGKHYYSIIRNWGSGIVRNIDWDSHVASVQSISITVTSEKRIVNQNLVDLLSEKNWVNREIVIFAYHDSFSTINDAKKLYRGVIENYSENNNTIILECGDKASRENIQIPQTNINTSQHPSAPDNNQGEPIPIVFGDFSLSDLYGGATNEDWWKPIYNTKKYFPLIISNRYAILALADTYRLKELDKVGLYMASGSQVLYHPVKGTTGMDDKIKDPTVYSDNTGVSFQGAYWCFIIRNNDYTELPTPRPNSYINNESNFIDEDFDTKGEIGSTGGADPIDYFFMIAPNVTVPGKIEALDVAIIVNTYMDHASGDPSAQDVYGAYYHDNIVNPDVRTYSMGRTNYSTSEQIIEFDERDGQWLAYWSIKDLILNDSSLEDTLYETIEKDYDHYGIAVQSGTGEEWSQEIAEWMLRCIVIPSEIVTKTQYVTIVRDRQMDPKRRARNHGPGSHSYYTEKWKSILTNAKHIDHVYMAGKGRYYGEEHSFELGLDFSDETTSGRGVLFNGDGSKIYIIGDSEYTVFAYDLTTNYDLFSDYGPVATYNGENLDFGADSSVGECIDLEFNDDGTKLFLLDVGGGIHVYTLSTEYDVSTGTLSLEGYDASSEIDTASGFTFSKNGKHLYILDASDNTIHQYDLSTAFDLSTCDYTSQSLVVTLDVSSEIFTGIAINNDGAKIYVVEYDHDYIREYVLGTAYEIDTGVASDFYEIDYPATSSARHGYGLAFDSYGMKFFTASAIFDEISIFFLGISYNLRTVDLIQYHRDIVYHLLTQELGANINDLNYDSFDVIGENHILAFSLYEHDLIFDFLFELCSKTQMFLVEDSSGKWRAKEWKELWNTNNVDYTIDFDTVAKHKYQMTSLDTVYNKIIMKYDVDYITGLYDEQIEVEDTTSQGSSASGWNTTKVLEIENQFVKDSTTATNIANWMLKKYKKPRLIIEITCEELFYYEMELLDIVKLDGDWPNTQGQDVTTVYFMVVSEQKIGSKSTYKLVEVS